MKRDAGGDEDVEQAPEEPVHGFPLPTSQFRRRAWREFQRALDPLAPPKSLPMKTRRPPPS